MYFCVIMLGLLLGLLIFLAIYQQTQARNAQAAKKKKIREESSSEYDLPPGKTLFFVARFNGYGARFFRVYADQGQLLFLMAGPYFIMIDAEAPRGESKSHWLVRSLKLLAITLASGAVASLLVLMAVGRAIAQSAQGFTGSGHVIAIILGVIGLLALVNAVFIPSVLWLIDQRGKMLDSLPLSGLREIPHLESKSFIATPANVTKLSITLLDQRENFRPSDEVGSTLKFNHGPTGTWKIETLTTRDTRAALEMLPAVWGSDKVQVDQALIDRLARTVVAGNLPLNTLGESIQPQVQAAQARVIQEDHDRAITAAAEKKRRAEAPKIGDPGSTFSMNGIGTMVCDGRGIVEWDYTIADSDALLAFCFLGIPLIPYKAVHAYSWGPGADIGLVHKQHPIRWTWDLTASAYLRRVWGVLVVLGALLLFASYTGGSELVGAILAAPPNIVAKFTWLDPIPVRILLAGLGLLLVIGPIFGRIVMDKAERRHQNIRRLLGRHLVGSSDPANWPRSLLDKVRPALQSFGSDTFAEASESALKQRDYRQAIFAARLAVALEDPAHGESLTSSILETAEAQQLIEAIHKNPLAYSQLLPPSSWDPIDLLP